MSIFTKAWQGENLSPGARAFLKLLQNLLWTALIAGALALTQYLNGVQQIDWIVLARTVAVGAAIAVLSALYKYFSAQADTPLGAAGAMATDAIEKKLEALSVGIQTPSAPAPVPPVSVTIHTSTPVAPESTVSTPTATPAMAGTTNTAIVPAVSTGTPTAPVDTQSFEASLANSFAFGTPTETSAQPATVNSDTISSSDTAPRPAVGK